MDARFRSEYLDGLYAEMKKFEELQEKLDVPELATYSETVFLRINNLKHDNNNIHGYTDEAFVFSVKKVYVALISYFSKFLEKHKFKPDERKEFENAFVAFRDNVNQKIAESVAAMSWAARIPSTTDRQRYAKDASERILSIFAALCRMHELLKKYA